MPLTKFSNYIRAHADRAFLASCTCKGADCSCTIPTIHSNESKRKMPSLFPNLSAADRKTLANKILDLRYEEQRQVVQELGSIVEKVNAAEAVSERKKVALERINACKADAHGGRAAIDLLNGTLRRNGMPSVEQLAEKSPDEVMSLFAASTMASQDKFACKITLSKLRVIP
jgi:hypothetical protein